MYEVDVDILEYAAHFHGFTYNSEEKIVEWLKCQELSGKIIYYQQQEFAKDFMVDLKEGLG